MLILTFINNNTNSRLIGEDKATAEFISNINIDGWKTIEIGWLARDEKLGDAARSH